MMLLHGSLDASLREFHDRPVAERLFFALWPGAAVSAELSEAGKRLYGICGGRRTRVETIHLTLVFLGDVEPERIDNLRVLAGGVRAPAFAFNLTRLGWWAHNRIAWAAPDETPEELVLLTDALRERLLGAGFHFDTKPFVPHITMLRKAECGKKPLPSVAIEWRVEDFVLVRSVAREGGSVYEVAGRWPLLRG